MVVIEKQHNQEPERHGYENPFRVEVPKVNQPAARLRWRECLGDWDTCDIGRVDPPRDVREANPEDGAKLMPCQTDRWKRSGASLLRRETYNIGVVGEDSSKSGLPDLALSERFKSVDRREVENGNHARQVPGGGSGDFEFVDQLLYSLDRAQLLGSLLLEEVPGITH